MTPPIITVVTTAFGDASLLPHFIEHYQSLGATRILLCVNEAMGVQLPSYDKWFVIEVSRYSNPNGFGMHLTQPELDAVDVHCRVGDPVIFADLDEFYEFPEPLPVLIAAMQRRRFDLVYGSFLDRVTVDGSIPTGPLADEIDSLAALNSAFPVGCLLTRNITKVCDRKVMLTTAGIKVSAGHHGVNQSGVRAAPAWGTVHHFKWRGDVIERTHLLEKRYGESGIPATRVARLRAWLGDPPRIDLTDPLISARTI